LLLEEKTETFAAGLPNPLLASGEWGLYLEPYIVIKSLSRKNSRRGPTKKDQKIAKKHRKIALLSLYLLYLYHL